MIILLGKLMIADTSSNEAVVMGSRYGMKRSGYIAGSPQTSQQDLQS